MSQKWCTSWKVLLPWQVKWYSMVTGVCYTPFILALGRLATIVRWESITRKSSLRKPKSSLPGLIDHNSCLAQVCLRGWGLT